MGAAVIAVKGRYPERNFLVNEITKELVYITSGQGQLLSPDGAEHSFKTGDAVFVSNGEAFAWEGDFTGFFANTPVFDPAQHKEVDA
jgi:hypothetical protein